MFCMFRILLLAVLFSTTFAVTAPALRAELGNDQRIRIFRPGQTEPILVQNAQADFRAFIHPIVAPDGKGVLTEDSPGHHHWQHGLYVGLNQVNGLDFWKNDKVFHPKPLAAPTVKGNAASWVVESLWMSPKNDPVLNEVQAWTLTDHGAGYWLDLAWKLTGAVDVTFGKYQYGGLFLRMPFKGKGQALTSEGKDAKAAEGQRARWVAISMPIEGRTDDATIAIFDHPTNAEHPVPWRVDNQLGIAPSRCIVGDWKLAKGQSITARYRVLVMTGSPDATRIEAEWKQFAK